MLYDKQKNIQKYLQIKSTTLECITNRAWKIDESI